MEPSEELPILELDDDFWEFLLSPSFDDGSKKPRMNEEELPSASFDTTSCITSSSTQTNVPPLQQSTSTQTESDISLLGHAVQKPTQSLSATCEPCEKHCWYCQNPGACSASCPTGTCAYFTQSLAPATIMQPFATSPALQAVACLQQQQPMVLFSPGPQTSVQDIVTAAFSTLANPGLIATNSPFGALVPTSLNLIPLLPSSTPVTLPMSPESANADGESRHVQQHTPKDDFTTPSLTARNGPPRLAALTAPTPVTLPMSPKPANAHGECRHVQQHASNDDFTTPSLTTREEQLCLAALTAPTPVALPMSPRPANADGEGRHVQQHAPKNDFTTPSLTASEGQPPLSSFNCPDSHGAANVAKSS
ncbi:hypothetical protein MRX96_037385 [Rhipicephalus microplus]